MNATIADNLTCLEPDDHHSIVQVIFGALYATVFVASVIGNSMVICVVMRNRAMQTVTYLFIANLAFSDLLVTLTSMWITPLYAFMSNWIWGIVMCYAFPFFQASSTFISTLTLLAIAADRYVAILYPFKRHMSKMSCIIVIGAIWCFSIFFTVPYVTHIVYFMHCDFTMCAERWPNDEIKVLYGMCVLVLQFGIPFGVIGYCYMRIWRFMVNRKTSIQTSSSTSSMTSNIVVKRSDFDIRKRKKLIKMLIAMVTLFALCWLPMNLMNILKDFLPQDYNQLHFTYLFIIAHFISMSATCWNPILYAWMNDKFRNEFICILRKYLEFGRCLKRKLSSRRDTDVVEDCAGYTEEEFHQRTTPSVFDEGQVAINNLNSINYFNFK